MYRIFSINNLVGGKASETILTHVNLKTKNKTVANTGVFVPKFFLLSSTLSSQSDLNHSCHSWAALTVTCRGEAKPSPSVQPPQNIPIFFEVSATWETKKEGVSQLSPTKSL